MRKYLIAGLLTVAFVTPALAEDFYVAVDLASGRNTGGSIGGGVISYALDGKQYVATTSGTVSVFFGGSGLPAVVIFTLP